jgi:pilus assembly protein Flp/PilA
MDTLKSLIVEEEGAEIAEYALLVVILALGLLAAAPGLKDSLTNAFSRTGNKVSSNAADPALN